MNPTEITPSSVRGAEFCRQAEVDVYKGIRMYLLTLVVLTAVAWCVVGIRGSILHEPYPRNTLFFRPEVRFTDFLDLSERVPHLAEPHVLSRTDINTPYRFPGPYPYPVSSFYIFVAFVRLFPLHPLRAYLIFVLLGFLLATCLFSLRIHDSSRSKLPQIAVWSTLVLGFPLQFLIDRANIEGVIWILTLLGLVAYIRKRTLTSALVWGLAASMKVFPGLLFLLFLARRKFGMFIFGIVSTIAFSLLALTAMGPTVHQAAIDSSKSAPFLRDVYIIPHDNGGFDHSLFQAVKHLIYIDAWAHEIGHVPFVINTRPANEIALHIYNFVIPLAAILLYWFRLRRLPILNQFIAFILLCVLLPYVSGEYTLVHIYMAWGAFLLFLLNDVATGRVRMPAWTINVILFSCAVIFVPLSYLVIIGASGRTFAFGSQVKTISLILILVMVLRVPMPSSVFGDLQIPDPSRAES